MTASANVVPRFDLQRDAHGHLVLTDAQGQAHVGVYAVRAFPISAPEGGVSLMDAEAHELVWISDLACLPAEVLGLVRESLTQREFLPTIQKVLAVSSFVAPSVWTVETDRGQTDLMLKGEENIRRLAEGVLIVSDAHGVQFLIRDVQQMDKHSRKLLDRFL